MVKSAAVRPCPKGARGTARPATMALQPIDGTSRHIKRSAPALTVLLERKGVIEPGELGEPDA